MPEMRGTIRLTGPQATAWPVADWLQAAGYAVAVGDGPSSAPDDLVVVAGWDPAALQAYRERTPGTCFVPVLLLLPVGQPLPSAEWAAAADDVLVAADEAGLLWRVAALLRVRRHCLAVVRREREMVAMLVHDLRSPLTALMGFAEILWEDPPPAERRECATQMYQSAHRMVHLVNDILELFRLEAGAVTLRLESIDPGEWVSAALAEVRPLAAGRGLQLHLDVPATLPPLLGDRRRLWQVLANLLDNAVKFAARHVTVAVTAGTDQLVLAVSDDGPGVAAGELAGLFGPWRQAAAGQASGKGSGLGLAIVKRLVEAHGGSVAADAGPEGGLRVTVRLPLVPPA